MRERRAAHWYRLHLPIIVSRTSTPSSILNGRTRNISAGGIYFTTDRHLAVNEVVDFSLSFAGLVEGADILVKGQARVLRLVQRPETISERVGVAAIIENFRILSARADPLTLRSGHDEAPRAPPARQIRIASIRLVSEYMDR